jgi:hypothetical protein
MFLSGIKAKSTFVVTLLVQIIFLEDVADCEFSVFFNTTVYKTDTEVFGQER